MSSRPDPTGLEEGVGHLQIAPFSLKCKLSPSRDTPPAPVSAGAHQRGYTAAVACPWHGQSAQTHLVQTPPESRQYTANVKCEDMYSLQGSNRDRQQGGTSAHWPSTARTSIDVSLYVLLCSTVLLLHAATVSLLSLWELVVPRKRLKVHRTLINQSLAPQFKMCAPHAAVESTTWSSVQMHAARARGQELVGHPILQNKFIY